MPIHVPLNRPCFFQTSRCYPLINGHDSGTDENWRYLVPTTYHIFLGPMSEGISPENMDKYGLLWCSTSNFRLLEFPLSFSAELGNLSCQVCRRRIPRRCTTWTSACAWKTKSPLAKSCEIRDANGRFGSRGETRNGYMNPVMHHVFLLDF